jgi:hypothetical protein
MTGVALALVVAALVSGCAAVRGTTSPATETPRVILEAPTRVPIRIVQNITLVQVTLNRVHLVTLIVDTGAQSTIISPAIARRLGLTVPPEGPRRQVSVVGGSKLDVPFVKLSVLRVGDAIIEGMEVGVFDVAPTARGIHGLLGADFLHQFRFTLDGNERWMHLEPLKPGAGRGGVVGWERLQVARGGQGGERRGGADAARDGVGDGIGGGEPEARDVGGSVAHGEGEDGVAVEGGVGGRQRAGEAQHGERGDLRGVRPGETRGGRHHADRGVLRGVEAADVGAGAKRLRGVDEAPAVRGVARPRDQPARVRIAHVADGVHRDDRADHHVADARARAPDAAAHRVGQAA